MSNIFKATLIVISGTILSKFFGFFRDIVLASTYGTTIYADAYIVSLIIPMMLFGVLGSALGVAFVPIYCEVLEKKGIERAKSLVNNVFNIVIVICAIVSIFGMIFIDGLMGIIAPGFHGKVLVLATSFTKIMLPGIVFVALNYLLTSYLHSHNNFVVPAVMGIPFNILIILSIILSAKGNIYLLAYGMLTALFVQFLFQLVFAYKLGYKHSIKLNYKSYEIKKLVQYLFPVFVGLSVLQFSFLIDRVFASSLVEGSISALNFAGRLNEFVFGVFSLSIASVIYPIASKMAAGGEGLRLQEQSIKAVNVIILLLLPITAFFLVLAEPIVKLIFERGFFDNEASKMTAAALFYYAFGIIGFGVRDVLLRTYYANLDTRTPMINSIQILILNIVLNFVFVSKMAHGGLALATSISISIGTILLFFKLKWYMQSLVIKEIMLTSSRSAIAAFIMGISVKIIHKFMLKLNVVSFIGDLTILMTVIFLGFLLYFLLAVVFRIKEIKILTDKCKRIYMKK